MLQAGELEDRVEEITDSEQEKKERERKEMTVLRDLWDNIKHTNIHIMAAVPKLFGTRDQFHRRQFFHE